MLTLYDNGIYLVHGETICSCPEEAAQKSGAFKDEIVPVEVKKKKETVIVDTDEGPRHGTTVETLGKLKPAFKKDGG